MSGIATAETPPALFWGGVFARGDDEGGGECILRYPLNNGYRSLWNGRYTSPDPHHLATQIRFIGAQAYTYAAHRPQSWQDPDGRDIDGWESALAFDLVTPEQVSGYRSAAAIGGAAGALTLLAVAPGIEAAMFALGPRAALAAPALPALQRADASSMYREALGLVQRLPADCAQRTAAFRNAFAQISEAHKDWGAHFYEVTGGGSLFAGQNAPFALLVGPNGALYRTSVLNPAIRFGVSGVSVDWSIIGVPIP